MAKETMTSRQRVLAALNHQETDRIPIDLGGNQTGIHKVAYANLIKHLGIPDNLVIMDAVQQLAKPCESLLERFHVDTRYIAAGAAAGFDGRIVTRERDGRHLARSDGRVWHYVVHAGRSATVHGHFASSAGQRHDRRSGFVSVPRGDDPALRRTKRAGACESATRRPMRWSAAFQASFTRSAGTCGLQQWLMDTMTQPAFCEALLDCTLKFWMDWFRLFLQEVGDVVDVIMIGDDIAGQSGPLFRPDFYRRIVKPRHKTLVQYIRSRTPAKIWYHTCGSCLQYLPDLIDNGIHILNPVQISAANMDPATLKQQFGQQLVFWGGGIDAQHVLPTARPEEVRQHVRRNLEIWKPGGGYVFNNVHNIQADVPPENIVAFYDAAYEFGFYG